MQTIENFSNAWKQTFGIVNRRVFFKYFIGPKQLRKFSLRPHKIRPVFWFMYFDTHFFPENYFVFIILSAFRKSENHVFRKLVVFDVDPVKYCDMFVT